MPMNNASPVESADTEYPEPRPAKTKAEGRIDGDAKRRRRVVDRGGRRVIVSRRGTAVRLHHLGARIQARSRSKPECEDRQYRYIKFLPHDRYPFCCFAD